MKTILITILLTAALSGQDKIKMSEMVFDSLVFEGIDSLGKSCEEWTTEHELITERGSYRVGIIKGHRWLKEQVVTSKIDATYKEDWICERCTRWEIRKQKIWIEDKPESKFDKLKERAEKEIKRKGKK